MIEIADKATALLKEWASRYIKNRDLMLRSIEDFRESEDSFFVKFKTKEVTYYIVPFFTDKRLDELKAEMKSDKHVGIFIFNTKDNMEFVVKNWQDFIKNPKLIIYFFNPFSRTDKVWSIYPSTHHYISDGKAIKTGLQSLASNVEETTEEDIKKIAESD